MSRYNSRRLIEEAEAFQRRQQPQGRQMNRGSKWGALGVASVILFFGGCSYFVTQSKYSPAADEVTIHYEAPFIGSFSDMKRDNCYYSGDNGYDGPGDEMYSYKTGKRTFSFGNQDGAEFPAIEVASSDPQPLTVSGLVSFKLNTDCGNPQVKGESPIFDFHEDIGIKYKAWTEDGWKAALRDYMGTALNQAADQASRQYTWQQLYSGAVKEEWEADVGKRMADALEASLKADYFCSPDFIPGEDMECGDLELTLQAPEIPSELQSSLTAKQQAVLDQQTALKNNATLKAQANGVANSMRKLHLPLNADGLAQYTEYLKQKNAELAIKLQAENVADAIESGKITFMDLGGADAAVPVPR